MAAQIALDREAIAAYCRRHGIVKLALFGSVIRHDFRADSDVDVLVWFAPDRRVTFLDMAEMEEELSRLLGRRVDLRTPRELSHYFRDRVLAHAEVQYAA